MDHEALKNMFKQILTMKYKQLIHDKKTSWYRHIVVVRVTWHTWQPEIIFMLIRKHKYVLPVRDNLVVLCNLKKCNIQCIIQWRQMSDFRCGTNTVNVFRGVTHEWMSSVFEWLFLFWFLLMSLLSSWDDMGVCF